MKMIRPLLISFALLLAQQAPTVAKGNPSRGERIARENCSPCHAIGRTGASPNPNSPPMRTLGQRYPLKDLEEALAEGIVVGHEGSQMPMFQFGPAEIDNFIAYLRTIQSKRR